MNTQAMLKPISVRLPKEVDNQVRAYAKEVAKAENGRRPPLGRVLVALVEQGLKAIHPASRKAGLLQALQELDPEWSGKGLRDIEPLAVSPRSGRSPVELLLARRG